MTARNSRKAWLVLGLFFTSSLFADERAMILARFENCVASTGLRYEEARAILFEEFKNHPELDRLLREKIESGTDVEWATALGISIRKAKPNECAEWSRATFEGSDAGALKTESTLTWDWTSKQLPAESVPLLIEMIYKKLPSVPNGSVLLGGDDTKLALSMVVAERGGKVDVRRLFSSLKSDRIDAKTKSTLVDLLGRLKLPAADIHDSLLFEDYESEGAANSRGKLLELMEALAARFPEKRKALWSQRLLENYERGGNLDELIASIGLNNPKAVEQGLLSLRDPRRTEAERFRLLRPLVTTRADSVYERVLSLTWNPQLEERLRVFAMSQLNEFSYRASTGLILEEIILHDENPINLRRRALISLLTFLESPSETSNPELADAKKRLTGIAVLKLEKPLRDLVDAHYFKNRPVRSDLASILKRTASLGAGASLTEEELQALKASPLTPSLLEGLRHLVDNRNLTDESRLQVMKEWNRLIDHLVGDDNRSILGLMHREFFAISRSTLPEPVQAEAELFKVKILESMKAIRSSEMSAGTK